MLICSRCPHTQEYVPHREGCWWDYRSRKLQDYELIRAFGTDKAGKLLNFRTDFSARESYEQQDAATGQKPNVGSVCVSILSPAAGTQKQPRRRRVNAKPSTAPTSPTVRPPS